VKLQWRLTKLEQKQKEAAGAGGGFVATFDTPQGVQIVHAKTVVSTAPAHALRHVLEPVLPNGAAALFDKQREIIQRNGIYHPPVAAVTVAYPKVWKKLFECLFFVFFLGGGFLMCMCECHLPFSPRPLPLTPFLACFFSLVFHPTSRPSRTWNSPTALGP